MILTVFSDIHGNIFALKKALHKMMDIAYDKIIFCGDIFGYYYNQQEVIAELSKIQNLIWLKGNHDAYAVDAYRGMIDEGALIRRYGHSYEGLTSKYSNEWIDFIDDRPECVQLTDGNRKTGIFHGTPEDPLEGRLYPDKQVMLPESYSAYDIVILGHTHCRMVRTEGETLIVNAGSLGQPRDGNGYGFAVVDTDSFQVTYHTIQIDTEKLYQQIDRYDPDLPKLKEVLMRMQY